MNNVIMETHLPGLLPDLFPGLDVLQMTKRHCALPKQESQYLNEFLHMYNAQGSAHISYIIHLAYTCIYVELVSRSYPKCKALPTRCALFLLEPHIRESMSDNRYTYIYIYIYTYVYMYIYIYIYIYIIICNDA